MSFKDKPLKKIVADKRITLDAVHTEMVDDFRSKKELYGNNKNELEDLKKEYRIRPSDELNQKIRKISSKIKSYDEKEEVDYYFDTGLLLTEYYSQKNNNSINKKEISVIDIMKKKNVNGPPSNSLIDTYMSKVDDTVVKDFHIHNIDKCPLCNEKLIIKPTDSQLLCEICGFTEVLIINSEKISYKDPLRESSYFSYKRINHFNEWLAQFQAKETTDIPDEIYKGIMKELKKTKFINLEDLSYQNIREILKRLKYNKYYEHIPHIINILNGRKAPLLTRKYEEQLRNMFKEIQLPFMKHCPEDRKNFLSYSYVLHKFCELIELDELLVYFPLLKSREKLQQQDKIWKNICNELKWQYIPSI